MKATYNNKEVDVLEFLNRGHVHIRFENGVEDFVHRDRLEFIPKESGRERSETGQYGRRKTL